jgi:hypothetical protein
MKEELFNLNSHTFILHPSYFILALVSLWLIFREDSLTRCAC